MYEFLVTTDQEYKESILKRSQEQTNSANISIISDQIKDHKTVSQWRYRGRKPHQANDSTKRGNQYSKGMPQPGKSTHMK